MSYEQRRGGDWINYSAAFCLLLRSLSSEMVSLVPLPLGKDIQGFEPSPMIKILVTRVANVRSRASLT